MLSTLRELADVDLVCPALNSLHLLVSIELSLEDCPSLTEMDDNTETLLSAVPHPAEVDAVLVLLDGYGLLGDQFLVGEVFEARLVVHEELCEFVGLPLSSHFCCAVLGDGVQLAGHVLRDGGLDSWKGALEVDSERVLAQLGFKHSIDLLAEGIQGVDER